MAGRAEFLRFLAAGGVAAAANFASRIGFSQVLPLEAAVVAAYLVGMAVAFVLMRHAVFPPSTRPLAAQVAAFAAINALAVAQTLVVTVVLARYVLPAAWPSRWDEEIAHAVGIAVPIATSYLGHRHVTFARRP